MPTNENSPHLINLSAIVPDSLARTRLDIALATLWPQYSRTRFKSWLEHGQVTLNQQTAKLKDKVSAGDTLEVNAKPPAEAKWLSQDIPVEIIYEDEALLIVNKPPGLVTHPAPGHYDSTLVNALIYHAPTLQHLPRAGLIHRLDKDTSGLLVVAKTLEVHHALVKDLQARAIKRHYEAIVKGVLTGGGRIETFLGRDPKERTRIAVRSTGKLAITHYRVLKRLRAHTHVSVQLETGRTHQIRVHMAHINHAIVGDPVYGHRTLPKGSSEPVRLALTEFKRQALHAKSLGLTHPITQKYCEWEAPLPADMQQLLAILEEDIVQQ